MGTPWSLQGTESFLEKDILKGYLENCLFHGGKKKEPNTTKTEFSYFGLKRLPTNKTVRSHLLFFHTGTFCWPSSTVRRRNGQVQLPRSHFVQQRFGEAVHVPTQSRWDAQIRSGVRKSFRISRMWEGVNFFDESKGVWRQTRLYLTPTKTSCITILMECWLVSKYHSSGLPFRKSWWVHPMTLIGCFLIS